MQPPSTQLSLWDQGPWQPVRPPPTAGTLVRLIRQSPFRAFPGAHAYMSVATWDGLVKATVPSHERVPANLRDDGSPERHGWFRPGAKESKYPRVLLQIAVRNKLSLRHVVLTLDRRLTWFLLSECENLRLSGLKIAPSGKP